MFTNQFGMQVKADWASFSITRDQLKDLIRTVISRIAHEAGYMFPQNDPLTIHIDNDEEYLEVNLHHNDEGILDILSEKNLYEESEVVTAEQLIKLMFGETTEYSHSDEDGDIILRINFEEYIRRVHGI